ncbi:ethanolamine ammonia-lyase subunit EutB [Telmatocola sphagniphila]|uniref:Ethanolamine ammonia-lyase large subunit n=1 Tax=Telmatocola sphagniphila TaxID=1123043 RepID=A0A8E6B5W9_9BACT|nr:ethanolamine ammonia-lyase subunit EutB [Telmatocola sphagniphila]QVL31083.1 ethanolamine ammonia-lyase subunit EutB [Telmatocola sphagniphila]
MAYVAILRGERFAFADLRELLAKANEAKSGDQLAGIAATSERQRAAAKFALADLPLSEILAKPLLDPDLDDVTRRIFSSHQNSPFQPIRSQTVGQFREWLLEDPTDQAALEKVRWGITPTMAAAVAKLMSNKELIYVARKIRIVTRCRNTIGEEGVFAVRAQPNHPTDDLPAILLGALEGLAYGCGDAVIGINPAAESIEAVSTILRGLDRLIETLQVPTQACCLAHFTTQIAAMERGAPVDLLFQSIAGTQKANASFGVELDRLTAAAEKVREHHRRRDVHWVGEQFLYFETGQGSALSAEAHHGIDQLTLEAQAYGLARTYNPFLINSVVGFIGPEYLADERQITRAGLEDHFMGKLLGLPMGVDVCYTNHAEADANSTDNLLILLASAGCNYVMGVPASDDVMLNYQSTSYHDAALVRSLLQLKPAPEFAQWLESRGLFQHGKLALNDRLPALTDSLSRMITG